MIIVELKSYEGISVILNWRTHLLENWLAQCCSESVRIYSYFIRVYDEVSREARNTWRAVGFSFSPMVFVAYSSSVWVMSVQTIKAQVSNSSSELEGVGNHEGCSKSVAGNGGRLGIWIPVFPALFSGCVIVRRSLICPPITFPPPLFPSGIWGRWGIKLSHSSGLWSFGYEGQVLDLLSSWFPAYSFIFLLWSIQVKWLWSYIGSLMYTLGR